MKDLPPIRVISLSESQDRRDRISRQMEDHNLRFEFQDAVNGMALSEEQIKHCFDPLGAVRHTGGQLTRGQIGCALSHANLWRIMVDDDIDEAIILEDDAVLGPDFASVVEHRDDFPPDWELVLLYSGLSVHSIWKQRHVYQNYKLVRFVSFVAGTVAYLIRKSAAEKLLEAATPIRVTSDYLTGGWLETGVRMYGLQPNCVSYAPGPTTRSEVPVNLPGDFEAEKREYLGNHPPRSNLAERFIGLYRRLHPAFVRDD